jgi:hypothetical protein
MLNLIQIQDQLVEAVNTALARWSHRPCGTYSYPGHAGRTIGAARRKARAQLLRWEFTPAQAEQAIRDAMEHAQVVRRHAEVD